MKGKEERQLTILGIQVDVKNARVGKRHDGGALGNVSGSHLRREALGSRTSTLHFPALMAISGRMGGMMG